MASKKTGRKSCSKEESKPFSDSERSGLSAVLRSPNPKFGVFRELGKPCTLVGDPSFSAEPINPDSESIFHLVLDFKLSAHPMTKAVFLGQCAEIWRKISPMIGRGSALYTKKEGSIVDQTAAVYIRVYNSLHQVYNIPIDED